MAIRVDYRASLSLVGSVLKFLSVPLALPLVVAVAYGESPAPFLVTAAVTVAVGWGLERLRPDPDIGAREGFLMVAMTWLVVSVIGAIPYLIEAHGLPGVVPATTPESTLAHPSNALFETMSGFTTTGATVLGQISLDTHGHGIMLWRQLTQWIGGMGIIVLMVAILSELSVAGAQIINEEAPGFSLEKLTPQIQETARALWKIYLGFTVAAALVYYGLHFAGVAPNMGAYNAVAHALTTMPTGGFSPEARSVEAFAPIVQWAVMPFMIVAGTNFALLWYLFNGEPRQLTKNPEFRTYLLAVAAIGSLLSVLLVTGLGMAEIPTNIGQLSGDLENSLRQGLFQTIAIITTTGYASMDFNTWGESAQLVLLFAMFLGGSAGSAAGSVKIIRWYIVSRAMGRQLFTTIHPSAIRPIRLNDDTVNEETVRDIFVFIFTFVSIFVFSTVLIYLDALRIGLDISALEAISATIATLGNIGPGVGIVGPMDNFRPFSAPAKLYMVVLMWIGRLEIISVLVVFTPSFWQR